MRRLSDIYKNIKSVEEEMSRILAQKKDYTIEELKDLAKAVCADKEKHPDKRCTEYAMDIAIYQQDDPEIIREHIARVCRNRFDDLDPLTVEVPPLTFVYDCLYGPIENVPEYVAAFPITAAWRLNRA